MRIVEINSGNHGSVGRIMLGISESASKRGHEVYTFCPPGRMQSKGIAGNEFIGTVFERRASDFFNCLLGYQGRFNWIGTRAFINQLKRIKPDIVHIHNLHSNYINMKTLFNYLKESEVKVVWSHQDCWAFTGHCVHFLIAKCDRWKTRCYDCPNIKEYPQSYFFDRSKEEYAYKKKLFCSLDNMVIVTPTKWLENLMRESFFCKYRVVNIENGIDTHVFRERKSDVRSKLLIEGKFVILGVAFSWGFRKGLDVFSKLQEKLNSDYTIVLVGVNDKMKATLPDEIITVKRTETLEELAEIYTCADVFVNPTREETCGLVNIEALSCGTPVITFRTGGSPECIDDNCGSVVEVDDVDSLAREIERVRYEHPFTKEACVNRARKFERMDVFEKYVDLYEELGGVTDSQIKKVQND